MRMFVANFFRHLKRTTASCRNAISTQNNFFYTKRNFVTAPVEKPKFPLEKYSESKTQNLYYRNCILNDSNYAQLIYREDSPIPVTESSCKSLKLLKEYEKDKGNIEMLTELPDLLTEELNNLTHDELLDLTHVLLKICRGETTLNQKFFIELIPNFDKELKSRAFSLSVEETLRTLDMIYHSHYFKKFIYFYISLKRLCRHLDKLSHSQAVHVLYLVSLLKKDTVKEFKFNLENTLCNIIPHLPLFEVGIIVRGFLRSDMTFSHPDIYLLLVDTLYKNTDQANTIPFKTICNILARSGRSNDESKIEEFQEKMIPQVSAFNERTLVAILLMNVSNHLLNKNLTEVAMTKIKQNIDNCFDSDLERLTFLTARFNIDDEEFLKKAVAFFEERKVGFRGHVIVVTKFMMHLMHHRIYPEKLIGDIMTEEFIKNVLSENLPTAVKYWHFVNSTLEIEKPEYACATNEQLKKKISTSVKFSGRRRDETRIRSKRSKLHYVAEEFLFEMYGENSVLYVSPLPHYPPVLLMKFDKNLKVQIIPKDFVKGFFIKKPLDNDFWIATVFINRDDYADEYKTLNYIAQTQLRQFTLLGYHPVLVVMRDFGLKHKYGDGKAFMEDLMNAKLSELKSKYNL